jgi:hypothetical protein
MEFELIWSVINIVVEITGWLIVLFAILAAIGTFIAFLRGVLKPLWRLGLGLARKKVVIVASQTNADSLFNLVSDSKVFSEKNIIKVTSREDSEDIRKGDVVLYKYSDSQFSLKDVMVKKADSAAVVVYAKPREITEQSEWDLLDEYRNVSVCNLKGRLLNDLITLMMTTKL